MYQGASSNWFSKGHHKEGVHSRTLPGRSIEEGRQGPPPMPWIQGLIFFGEGWFMIYIYICWHFCMDVRLYTPQAIYHPIVLHV